MSYSDGKFHRGNADKVLARDRDCANWRIPSLSSCIPVVTFVTGSTAVSSTNRLTSLATRPISPDPTTSARACTDYFCSRAHSFAAVRVQGSTG